MITFPVLCFDGHHSPNLYLVQEVQVECAEEPKDHLQEILNLFHAIPFKELQETVYFAALLHSPWFEPYNKALACLLEGEDTEEFEVVSLFYFRSSVKCLIVSTYFSD